MNRQVGIGHAVHAYHAQAEYMAFGEAPDSKQGGDYRDLRFLGQVLELWKRTRDDNPSAGDDNRAF